MQVLIVRVAGVTFEGRQAKIERLNGSEAVRLVPEPENIYDSNALAVQVSKDGELLHVGYVPRELAAKIAPVLQGETLMVKILEITGGFQQHNGFRASLGLKLKVELPESEVSDISF